MEDVDYITISDNDDDEVEVLEQFISCEPIIIDLTDGDRPESKRGRGVLEDRTQQQAGHDSSSEQRSRKSEDASKLPSQEQTQQPSYQEHPFQQASQEQTQRESSQNQAPPNAPIYQEQSQRTSQREQASYEPPSREDINRTQINHEEVLKQQPSQREEIIRQQPFEEGAHSQPYINHEANLLFRDQSLGPTILDQIPKFVPNNQQSNPIFQERVAVQEPVKRTLSEREIMIAKKEKGNKKFRCNSFDEAVRLYREAIELSRKLNDQEMTAILHFNLAMSYDRLGSYTQAADECAAAVKINDHYIKAHVKRAEIYMAQGKYDEAVICYEHICEIDSSKQHEAMRRIVKAKELAKTVKKRDQYEILGLRPHFSFEELKTSYKQKARAHHPDRHSDADIVTRRIQEKIFKEASEANAFFRKRFGYH